MGKAPLILQYLHDHAQLVCDRLNSRETAETGEIWNVTPLPSDMRRNILFHYGSATNFHEYSQVCGCMCGGHFSL